MATTRIVEALDEIEDRGPCLGLRLELALTQLCALANTQSTLPPLPLLPA
jgi:hypothetical protein